MTTVTTTTTTTIAQLQVGVEPSRLRSRSCAVWVASGASESGHTVRWERREGEHEGGVVLILFDFEDQCNDLRQRTTDYDHIYDTMSIHNVMHFENLRTVICRYLKYKIYIYVHSL